MKRLELIDHSQHTFTSLYDRIQECFDYNLKQSLELLVSSPGLKLIDDDWTCKLSNNNITIILGMAVFGDYDVFSPGETKTAIIEIPPTLEEGKAYYICLRKTSEEDSETDHPYYIMPDGAGSIKKDVYRHTCASIVLCELEEANDIEIASITKNGGIITLQELKERNNLKLTEIYPLANNSAAPIEKVKEVEVSTTYISLMRQESLSIGGDVTPIDKSEFKNDLPIITVSWDEPEDEELVGKTFAYKVIAHPSVLGSDRRRDLEEFLLYPDSLMGRIYCSFYASDGVEYEIEIYRLVNPTRPVISLSSGIFTIRAGEEEISGISTTPDTIELNPVFEMSSALELVPRFNNQYSAGNFRMQVFIFDAKTGMLSTPVMPPTAAMMQNLKYLYYEGPIKKILYISDASSYGVAALARIIGSGQKIVATSDVKYVAKTTEQASNDTAMSVYIPDDGNGAVADRIVCNLTATRSFVIRAIMMSGYDDSDSIDAGQLQIYKNGEAPASGYIMDYDDNGDGYTDTFAGNPPVFNTNDGMVLRCVADGASTDPSRCTVTIFIRNIE